jgi:hypothetical protein
MMTVAQNLSQSIKLLQCWQLLNMSLCCHPMNAPGSAAAVSAAATLGFQAHKLHLVKT